MPIRHCDTLKTKIGEFDLDSPNCRPEQMQEFQAPINKVLP